MRLVGCFRLRGRGASERLDFYLAEFHHALVVADAVGVLERRPCWSAIRPVANLASCAPSTVFCPLSITVNAEPLAVIS